MLALWVPGTPGPKGSTTRNQYGHVYNMSKIGAAWEEAVFSTCVNTIVSPVPPPYRVEVEFYVKRPRRPKRAWPSTNDLDKLLRATIDGLVRGFWILDDRHITRLAARKQFGDESGAGITIRHDGGPEEWSNGRLLL